MPPTRVDEPDDYRTPAPLRSRSSIYAFQEPALQLHEWVLDLVDWAGGERVLDVGCGDGNCLRRLARLDVLPVGLDLAPGMLAAIDRAWAPVVNGDVLRLPFATASVDVILAVHMLYYLPDIAAAATELRRVLRPGGVLVAATNGEHDKDQIEALIRSVEPGYRSADHRFTLENGATPLGGAFDRIVRHELRAQLVVPEPGPVVEFAASARPRRREQLETVVAAHIARQGAFVADCHVGAFVCR